MRRLETLACLLLVLGFVVGCSQDKRKQEPKPTIAVKTSELEKVCRPESKVTMIVALSNRYLVVCLDGRVKEVDPTP